MTTDDKVIEDRMRDALIAVTLNNQTKDDESGLFFTIPQADDRCAAGTYWRNSRSGMSLHTAPEYSKALSQAGLSISPGWQEISTAPRLDTDGYATQMFGHEDWVAGRPGYWCINHWCSAEGFETRFEPQPTHWQPLPLPPQKPQEQSK